MMTKGKRVQIRVSDQELDEIRRKAKAAGLNVADYARQRLLADLDEVEEQEPLRLGGEWTGNFEGEPAASYHDFAAEAAWEGMDEGLPPELKAQLTEEHGMEFPDWTPQIKGRISELVAEAIEDAEMPKECSVTDLPAGVICIECGEAHGS